VARRYRTPAEEFDVQLNWLVAGVVLDLVALPSISTDHAASIRTAALHSLVAERMLSTWKNAHKRSFLKKSRASPYG
jgi:hypothetical protein